MADTFTNITTFINSPPGQLIAGATLGGIVFKLFAWVENVLNDDAKLELAVWLFGISASQTVSQAYQTFLVVFEHCFGRKNLSFIRLWRATVISAIIFSVCLALFNMDYADKKPIQTIGLVLILAVVSSVPAYLSAIKTRRLLLLTLRNPRIKALVLVLCCDLLASTMIGLYVTAMGLALEDMVKGSPHGFSFGEQVLNVAASALGLGNYHSLNSAEIALLGAPLASSVLLWLYIASVFLLKFARRFDLGFQWFNSKFDIEKKPLQSIGLVSGAFVTMLYWTFAIVHRF